MVRAMRSDVALHAGVAPSTVSNVLNGRANELRIAPETADRIRASAQELGYVPRASARALRGGTSHTIGLMLGPLPVSVHVPILHDVVASAISRAQEREHHIVPFADPGGPGVEVDFVDRVIADVDLAGVISEISPRNAAAGRRLHQMDVPVVWMSFGAPAELPPGIGHVVVRQEQGVRTVLESLDIAAGEEVAVLVGPKHRPERVHVAMEIFAGAAHLIEAKSWLPDAGAETFRLLRQEFPKVRTIFCADDYLAIGVLHALREAGLSVPEDFSVVGFGGFDVGSLLDQKLTTIKWPVRELVIAAMDAMIDHVSGTVELTASPKAPVILELECQPVFGSTARLKI